MTTKLARRTMLSGVLAMVAGVGAGRAWAYDPKSRAPVNVDVKGIALRGHDPVAYFTAGKPVKGVAVHAASHAGAAYHFVSADNKALFEKDPAKYAPQYGGFCAWAVANGYKADADPTAWEISGGRLFVNYDASVAKTWTASKSRFIKSADEKWAAVMSEAPKSGWSSWLSR